MAKIRYDIVVLHCTYHMAKIGYDSVVLHITWLK